MTDSYFNLQNLQSDFYTACDADIYDNGLSWNGSTQESSVAFAKQVKKPYQTII